jgi:hypothetical protein
MDWDESKLAKKLCASLHTPAHARTFPTHAPTCPNMPVHARTFPHGRGIAFSEAQARARKTFPRLGFGLVSHAADGPFLTACGRTRQIMESRIQLAQFEAASAGFAAKRC